MTIDKKILSVDFDDDDKNYEIFSEFLEDDTQRKKNLTAVQINETAESLLREIERKNLLRGKKKTKLIRYIKKNSHYIYSKEELNSYSFEDVMNIYNETKREKRSLITKIFQFIFNQ
jgi:hypothetical protein